MQFANKVFAYLDCLLNIKIDYLSIFFKSLSTSYVNNTRNKILC